MKERIEHERELRESHENSTTEALRIQAIEYERRLDNLNHAHEAAIQAQALTVPRETFDIFIKENDNKRELAFKNIEIAQDKRAHEVDRRLNGLEILSNRFSGAAALGQFSLERIMSLIAIAVAVYAVLAK